MSMGDLDRFLQKVQKTDSCWLWRAAYHPVGKYGKLYFRGKVWPAHRVAWCLYKGEITEGAVVMHKCDVRKCVNPDHLMLGTQADNLADMRAKKRHSFGALHYFNAPGHKELGERSRNAKLKDSQVRDIIKALVSKTKTRKELAAEYGVCIGTVHAIALRRNWGWLWDDIDRGPAEMKIVVGPGS